MKSEILNKLSAVNYNLRELLLATDNIRTDINKMKEITDAERAVVTNFYNSFNQFTKLQEVEMYLMILNLTKPNKENASERKYRKYYPGGTKTFN